MKNAVCLSLCLCWIFTCQGQLYKKLELLEELKNTSDNYRNKKYLSFDVVYKYSKEQQPAVYIDTLTGTFKITGNQYWYSMDNTEAVGNNEFMILLFKEDKIMYLTKPSLISAGQNPLALIDSFLTQHDDITYSLSVDSGQKRIILDFPGGSKYRRVEYYIDKLSGFVTKMVCTVQASELYDPGVQSLVEDTNTYAIIEASFTNYKESEIDLGQFNTTKYFKKQGDEFIALPPYENYKVFLGTTNLY